MLTTRAVSILPNHHVSMLTARDCADCKHTAQALGQYTDCPSSWAVYWLPDKWAVSGLYPPLNISYLALTQNKKDLWSCDRRTWLLTYNNGNGWNGCPRAATVKIDRSQRNKKQHLYRIKCDSRPITLTQVSFCVTLGSVRCTELPSANSYYTFLQLEVANRQNWFNTGAKLGTSPSSWCREIGRCA